MKTSLWTTPMPRHRQLRRGSRNSCLIFIQQIHILIAVGFLIAIYNCQWSLHFHYLASKHQQYDLVVYKATPSGCAAAIAAAEMGLKTLLLESTGKVGGMMTEGGIGMRDGRSDTRITDPRNSQVRWGQLNALHYGISSATFWQPDNFVGEESLLKLLDEAGVEIRLNTDFVEGSAGLVIENDRTLTSKHIRALRIEGGNDDIVYAKFFIDASYEGELMRAAVVSYTFGRESRDTYNESLAGITRTSAGQFPVAINPFEHNTTEHLRYVQDGPDPRLNVGSADDSVMAFSYRVCLTRNPNNTVPISPPDGYNPKDFEVARRLVKAEIANNRSISQPWFYLDYKGYNKIAATSDTMKYDACCGFSPFGIDNPALAAGFANASSRAKRDCIAAKHRYFVQGLMWFWQSDPAIPESIRAKHSTYGLCADEWADNDHFPRQLYVREAARIIGDRVFTQNDRSEGCRNDSIAVATWWFDIHNVQRVAVKNGTTETWTAWNEGLRGYPDDDKIKPFDLPYWIILPKREEVSNLAVPNCPSSSHVAFSAIREEPTLWALGHAAGVAAAIAVYQGLPSFHDVDLARLQEAIESQGGRLHWPDDRDCG